jgi:hypothetical protein
MKTNIDDRSTQLIERTNRIGIQFLFTDLDVAMTLLRSAFSIEPAEPRKRNLERAHEAYRTVVRLLPRVVPSAEERMELERKLNDLRSRLKEAGYSFEG